LIAPRQQAPRSTPKKDTPSRADWRGLACLSWAWKIRGFVDAQQLLFVAKAVVYNSISSNELHVYNALLKNIVQSKKINLGMKR
jgi:hypothetical protein